MKRLILYFMLPGILIISSPLFAQNSYVQKDSLPVEKFMGASFTIDDIGYVFGGHDYQNDLWAYDAVLDSWTQMATLTGQGRRGSMSFVIDTVAYIGGGYDGNYYRNEFQSYHPSTNSWVILDTLPFGPRAYGAAFSIDGKGYLGIGYDGSQKLRDFWQYDPINGTWIQKADCYDILMYSASFVLGQQGYVAGGSGTGNIRNSVYAYDPPSDTWIQKAAMPANKQKASGFELDGFGYVTCGESYNGAFFTTAHMFQYDPINNIWTDLAGIPGMARLWPFAFSINGKGYVGGGVQVTDKYQDFWEYSPPLMTGIIENSIQEIPVWPNPTKDFVHIQLDANELVDIISLDGKHSFQKVSRNQTIDFTSFASGIYFLRSSTGISKIIRE